MNGEKNFNDNLMKDKQGPEISILLHDACNVTEKKQIGVSDQILDMPAGPLDIYRKNATFDWKILKYIIEGKEMLKIERQMSYLLQKDPVFRPMEEGASFEDLRKLTFMRTNRVIKYAQLLAKDTSYSDYRFHCVFLRFIGWVDLSAATKSYLGEIIFKTALQNYGTERQLHIFKEIEETNAIGCITATEIGHGSNVRGFQTTATYESSTQEFVINTPTIEATKCWVGNLGRHACWSLFFAQLYTPDRKCHGLHMFLVPIRDAKTHNPFPGVIIGDMGPKIGAQGVDNGFMYFNNYRIPRYCLLNKQCDVTLDGKYVTYIKESKRFANTLGPFLFARLIIIRMVTANMMKALTIAIRYSAVRKQFGYLPNKELPILEYQLHQWRLIPYLAATYAMDQFSKALFKKFFECSENLNSEESDDNDIIASEMHAIVSTMKPLGTWLARDTIQECREACGANGLLKMAGLGDLREDHDALITYEGESNVLLQQAGNYILSLLRLKSSGKPIKSPFGVLGFLNDFNEIVCSKLEVNNSDDIQSETVLLDAFKWLICYLAKESAEKLKDNLRSGSDAFSARNNCQVFYLKPLALAFGQHTIFQTFYHMCRQIPLSAEYSVLRRLCLLYGLWNIEKHLTSFYEGGYISGPNFAKFIHQAILKLCEELKNDAVSLIDVFSVPDSILNNPLGSSDGNVYNRLYNALAHSPGTFSLPSWWKEYQDFCKTSVSINAKL